MRSGCSRGASWRGDAAGTPPCPAASIPLRPGVLGGEGSSTICCFIIKRGVYKSKPICCQTNCHIAELLREQRLARLFFFFLRPSISLITQKIEYVSSLRIMIWNPRPVHILRPAVEVRERARADRNGALTCPRATDPPSEAGVRGTSPFHGGGSVPAPKEMTRITEQQPGFVQNPEPGRIRFS